MVAPVISLTDRINQLRAEVGFLNRMLKSATDTGQRAQYVRLISLLVNRIESLNKSV